MLYGNTVEETRTVFFVSWQKYKEKKPLSPLESQLVAVILAHPEYHALFEDGNKHLSTNYFPEMGETNPFLHLGLHLAIREQINTDRPQGIHACYQALLSKFKDPLEVEHLMMEQLAHCLLESQKNQKEPNEQEYLASIRKYGAL